MRQITVKLYQFDELSEEAKDKAREWYRNDGGMKGQRAWDQVSEDAEHEFLHDLLEDYRVMLNNDIEYAYSQESIDEDMRANEYEFTEEGRRA